MKLRVLMSLTLASLGLAGGALAETSATVPAAVTAAHDMADMAMKPAALTSATIGYMEADANMHIAMRPRYTGDADVDFLRAMIPHHQGAVDMANVVLKYGSDPDVRMLAGDIVKAQEKEIKWMQDWLAKHGPKDGAMAMPLGEDGATPAEVKIPLNMIPKGMTPVAGKVETVATTAKTTVKDTVTGAVKTVVSTTTVIESSTIPASTIPAMDVSGSTALMMDGMPMGMTPEMPAADEAIPNDAPQMQLLEQPVKK